jgi:uncharacterized membrane protein HdeD (DUF308 family)
MQTLLEHWWLIALRGAAAIVVGVLALAGRVDNVFAFVLLFGSYAFADGLFFLVLAVRGAQRGEPWGSFFVGSLASVVAGVVAFVWSDPSALPLLSVIASWAVVTGVASIVAAVRVRKEIEGEGLLGLSGGCSVVFGLLLGLAPGPEPLLRVTWLGAYALVFGVLLEAFAVRLRGLRRHREPRAGPREIIPEPG